MVRKTLGASSLSEEVNILEQSGPESEWYIYNAPDRLEISNSPTAQPVAIVDGGKEYSLNSTGPGWTGVHNQKPGEVKVAVFGFLSQTLRSPSVQWNGRSLVAVSREDGFPSPADTDELVTTIRISGGYVSQERVVVHSDDPNWKGETLNISFTDIDSSPTISAPTGPT